MLQLLLLFPQGGGTWQLLMYSAGTSGHISPARLPPQTLCTSLIYCLAQSADTRHYIYSSWQHWHWRNTAVLFRCLKAAVRYVLHLGRSRSWSWNIYYNPLNQTASLLTAASDERARAKTKINILLCCFVLRGEGRECLKKAVTGNKENWENSRNKRKASCVSKKPDVTHQRASLHTLWLFAPRLIRLHWHPENVLLRVNSLFSSAAVTSLSLMSEWDVPSCFRTQGWMPF